MNCIEIEPGDATNQSIMAFGVGSPHGDDQVGWLTVELLRQRGFANAVALGEASELLRHFPACRRAAIVDGCMSGRPAGSVVHLAWPQQCAGARWRGSTHGIGVDEVLHLAEALGVLPAEVALYGVEIESCEPSSPASAATVAAARDVAARIECEFNLEAVQRHA